MADSSQERSEQATPRKLEKSREKGQVAVSRDLTGVVLLITATVLLSMSSEGISVSIIDHSRDCFRLTASPSPAVLLAALGSSASTVARLVVPLLIALFLASLAATFLQVGPLLALDPITPKLERLNPIEGIRNKLLKLRNVVELIKALLKVGLVIYLCSQVVREHLGDIVRAAQAPIAHAARLAAMLVTDCVARSLVALVVIGVLDFFYQRWQFLRDQRMSKEEVKREHKESDGDPHHKAARRQMHRDLADSNMLAEVPSGDAVIRNPTHIACVLRYDPDLDAAPRLIAKGEGWLAEEILKIAAASGVPDVRNVPLARSLRAVELHDFIPAELYAAAAESLRWAAEMAESRGRPVRWKTALAMRDQAQSEPQR